MNSDVRPAYETYEARAPHEDAYLTTATGQYDTSIATKPAGPATRKRKRPVEASEEDRTTTGANIPSDYDADSNIPRASIAVVSGAAIFRQPSTKSQKYTRPPIGKLYSSLELSPENFIRLQNAAKDYMLDENHPERLDTIGQRGRGDTDLVRLKLWNFVKEFLDDLGNGQKFFGEHVPHVEGQAPRSMIWPQDAEQIIKSCVPVLRRMVTNERQRQYAMHARKSNEDRQGHEPRNERRVARSASSKAAGLAQLSKADILELEIEDLLDDACVPGGYEAADWYSEHARQPIWHNGLKSSTLDERDYRILVANIDGHCRLFHNGAVSQCTDDCEAQAIERLLSWDKLYGSSVTSDQRERKSAMIRVIEQLFELIKADLQTRPSELDSESLRLTDRAAEDHGGLDGTVDQEGSARDRVRLARNAEPEPTGRRVNKTSIEALELHVNLVSTDSSAMSSPIFHSTKRLGDPFSLPAVSVPNLQALQSEVHRHFAKILQPLSSTDESGASRLGKLKRVDPELSVKVWLPDGLVRVRDDGEWMVALLSAELVEWMDKQVTILVEVLT